LLKITIDNYKVKVPRKEKPIPSWSMTDLIKGIRIAIGCLKKQLITIKAKIRRKEKPMNNVTIETKEDVFAIFSAFIAEYFDGIDPFQIKMEADLKALAGEQQGTMEQVIDELFSFYKVEKVQGQTFQKVEDLILHIASKVDSGEQH